MVEIVLDTALSASGVRDAYRNLLSGGGWEEENLDVPGGGGFARGPRGFMMSLGRTPWAACGGGRGSTFPASLRSSVTPGVRS